MAEEISRRKALSRPKLTCSSTGALAVFSFQRPTPLADASACHVWVCDFETEAELVEAHIGEPIEPGKWKIWSVDENELRQAPARPRATCWLQPYEIPPAWLACFPSSQEVVRKAVELRPELEPVDVRLLKRRDCEYEIFRSIEEAVELPRIRAGFESVESFISRAQTVLQRRKARSGRSLELHTREIFLEEKLRENFEFQHQPESDPGKKPDFLFPSEAAYKSAAFPAAQLRMLAVKTTCKDRWRQILNEAERIPHKHLLTLQEGVSEGQFREMTDAKVCLVVPRPLITAYPSAIQPHLQTLESFIGDVRLLNL